MAGRPAGGPVPLRPPARASHAYRIRGNGQRLSAPAALRGLIEGLPAGVPGYRHRVPWLIILSCSTGSRLPGRSCGGRGTGRAAGR